MIPVNPVDSIFHDSTSNKPDARDGLQPRVIHTCAPGMAHDLWGESPLYTYQEEVLAEDKGVVARRGLKEVESKALTRRTEIA